MRKQVAEADIKKATADAIRAYGASRRASDLERYLAEIADTLAAPTLHHGARLLLIDEFRRTSEALVVARSQLGSDASILATIHRGLIEQGYSPAEAVAATHDPEYVWTATISPHLPPSDGEDIGPDPTRTLQRRPAKWKRENSEQLRRARAHLRDLERWAADPQSVRAAHAGRVRPRVVEEISDLEKKQTALKKRLAPKARRKRRQSQR